MLSHKTMATLFLAFFVSFLVVPAAQAHSPSDIQLGYGDGILTVDITHQVLDPDTHYIESVVVEVNEEVVVEETYTSQPSNINFTYTYEVSALPGDVIAVTATCSLAGQYTEELRVPGASMTASLQASPSSVKPGETSLVTLTLSDGDDPVVGATVVMTVEGSGTIDDVVDNGDGTYTAKYHAPSSGPATDTIRCTATYGELEDASASTVIIVSSAGGSSDGDGGSDGDAYEPDDGGDDGGSTPGFQGALVIGALGLLAAVMHFTGRRR